VLKVGDEIDVYVLSVDPNERKIALSLKRTQPEPWSTITENYHLGQIVHGTITQLTTFGAFARLEDGIEGLIHVSELAEGRVAHPKNVVNVGDALDLKVIRIDPAKRRIGLSLKRVNEDMPGGAMPPAGTPEAEGNQYTEADPMSQTEQVEAHSDEVEEMTQQARTAMPTRQLPPRDRDRERERQQGRDRQDRRDREDRGGRDQRRAGNVSSVSDMDEEPMGALGQALAARLREMGSVTSDVEEETTPTQAAPAPTAAPEVEAATSAMPEEAAPEMEAGAPEFASGESEATEFESVEAAVAEPEVESNVEAGTTVEEPVAEAEAEPVAEAEAEPAMEAESEAEADIETSMPSAEEVSEAEAEAATDVAEQSGGEGAPSEGDADGEEPTTAS
jgi:predicted RNA-binding protein with RPS1 domain